MALIFKFDESYDNQKTLMTLGGWLMEESQWKILETEWKGCIDAANKDHGPDQQITRFHATELNGFKEEFKNWDKPMSEAFTASLVALLKNRPTLMVAASVDMQAMVKIYPATKNTMLGSAAGLCTKQVMLSLAEVVRKNFAQDKLGMVFESGNLDGDVNEAFKQMIADGKFKSRDRFDSISFIPKKPAGLQAADLIAYETLKRLLALRTRTDAKLRWALEQLLGNNHLGEVGYIGEETLKKLKKKSASN